MLPADSVAASATPRDGGTVIRRLDSECKTLNWVLYTTAYELFVLRHLLRSHARLRRQRHPRARALHPSFRQ